LAFSSFSEITNLKFYLSMNKLYTIGKVVCAVLFILLNACLTNTIAGSTLPPGQPRYLSMSIMNVERGDVYLPIMERAAAAGINTFYLNANWEHIHAKRGDVANWEQLDKQADLAARLGCKIMIRIWLARHDDGDGVWWPQETRPISGDGIKSKLLGGFSFSDESAVEEANGFVREVAEHFRARQQANQIVLVTIATSSTAEGGFNVDAFNPVTGQNGLQSFDYSQPAKRAFRAWVEQKYKTTAALNKAWNSDFSRFQDVSPPYTKNDVWSGNYGAIGQDWYLFRHFAQKNMMNKFITTLKQVDSGYKYVHDWGSCYDPLSVLRATLAFKDLCALADGLKVNDNYEYPHRFATDLLRSNLPGKIIGHEIGNVNPIGEQNWREHINEAYEHGTTWINFFGFDGSKTFPLGENLIRETATKWLKSLIPEIQTTQTVTYTLSEAFRMGTGRVQGQWRSEYAKTYTPIKVLLVEDLLNEQTSENRPPVVDITLLDQRVRVGQQFQYYIPESTFSDPDGFISSVTATGLPDGISMSGWNITGKALLSGEYIATITARDNSGAEVSTQFRLTVTEGEVNVNQPPVVARSIPDQTGRVGVSLSYEVARETFTDADGTVASVSFSGLPAGVSASGWRVSGAPTSAGVFTVTVTATDNAGASVSTPLKLTVTGTGSGDNQYPEVRRVIPDQTGKVGVSFGYDIAKETFVDPDGPIIDIAVTGLPAGVSASGWRVSGVPTLAGVYTVTVTARDNRDLKVSTQFKLTVSSSGGGNQPPVVARSIPDQSGRVGVSLSYEVARETFTDADGTVASVSFSGLPAGVSASGWRVSGIPTSAGTYTVTVTATDNAGASASTQFRLAIAASGWGNQPPVVARSIPDQSGRVGVSLNYEVARETFTDADGTVASVSFSGLPAGVSASGWRVSGAPTSAGVYTVTVTATDNAGASISTQFKLTVSVNGGNSNLFPVLTKIPGTLYAKIGVPYEYRMSDSTFVDPDGYLTTFTITALPDGLQGDGSLIRGTPTKAAEFIVNARVTDNAGGWAETTFRFIVVAGNLPPVVARSIPDQTGRVGVSLSYEVARETFTDADGTVASVSFSGLPAGVSASGWRVSGAPTSAGVFTVTVTATDNAGASVSTPLKLTVTGTGSGDNQYPEVRRVIPDQTGKVGVSFGYDIAKETFVDPDGPIIDIAVTGLPAGVSASGWRVSGVPTLAGVYTVTVTARDNRDLKVSTQFKLTVSSSGGGNQPPVVARSIPDQSGRVGVSLSYEVARETFTDADGTVASVSFSGLPAGVSASGWRVSGIPTSAGTYTVTVTATDNAGASASTQFKLSVLAAPGANTISLFTAGNFLTRRFISEIFEGDTLRGAELKQSVNILVSPRTGTVGSYSFALLGPVSVTSEDSNTPYGVFGDNGGSVLTPGNYTLTVRSYTDAGLQGTLISQQVVSFVVADGSIQKNRPPVLTKIPGTLYARIGKPYAYRMSDSTFVDPDGYLTTFTITALPDGLKGDGSLIVGTPTKVAEFTVNVRVTDNGGAAAETTFKLVITSDNQPPIVTGSVPDWSVEVNKPSSYILPAKIFEDRDGTISSITFQGLPQGISSSGLSLSGVPLKVGEYTVVVTATDDGNAATQLTFKIRVVEPNRPPVVAKAIGDQLADGSADYRFVIPGGTFADPDGNIVRLEMSGLPAGLTARGDTISGRPSQTGEFLINVKAFDNQNASVQHTFKLVVLGNRSPLVNRPIANQVATTNAMYFFVIPAGTFIDPDGRIVRLEISGLPPGITALGDTISGRGGQMGEFIVTVKAFDDKGAHVQLTFKLNVLTNSPPLVARLISDQVADSAALYRFVIPEGTFTDPDGRIVRIEFSGLPPGLTALGDTISGRPSRKGTYTTSVRAYDDKGAAVQTTFKFTVKDPTSKIIVASINDVIAIVGQVFTFDIKSYVIDNGGTLASISYASALPPGLTANGSQLAGNPSAVGNYPIRVLAKDINGGSVEVNFQLKVQSPELRILLYGMGQGTKTLIRPIANVDRMDVDTLPSALNIFVESNANITSVTFSITGSIVQNSTDESAPFGLLGDNGSFAALPGTYTLNVIGYHNTTVVTSRIIQFTIVKSGTKSGRLGGFESEDLSDIELWRPYPAPFVDRVKVQTARQGYTNLRAVEVLSVEGTPLPLPASKWTMDQSLLEVDLSGTVTLPGIYLLRITEENGKQKTLRILKAARN
jgi:hypothetical protein